MKEPLVSILFPVYNSSDYFRSNGKSLLPLAIESLLKQSYRNIEIIILDNQSTDSTPEICKKYADQDERIRYIPDTEQRTPDEATTYMSGIMKGDYCVAANDDDLWHPDFVKELVQCLNEKTDIDMVYCNSQWIDVDGKQKDLFINHESQLYSDKESSLANYSKYISNRNVLPIVFGMYRSEIYRKMQPFEPFDELKANVDNHFIAKFFLSGYKSYFHDKVLFYYREKTRALGSDEENKAKIPDMPSTKYPVLIWLYYIRHQFYFFRKLMEMTESKVKNNDEKNLLRCITINSMLKHIVGLFNWVCQDLLKTEKDRKNFQELSQWINKNFIVSDSTNTYMKIFNEKLYQQKIIEESLNLAKKQIAILIDLVNECRVLKKSKSNIIVNELSELLDNEYHYLSGKESLRMTENSSDKKIKRILFIPLEFMTWDNAKYWSYPQGLGFEEGFDACDIEYMTIPAIFETPFSSDKSLLQQLRNYIDQFEFDMVMFTASHSNLDEEFYKWIEKIAPIRCGFITESMTLTDEEWEKNPQISQDRVNKIEQAIRYCTHMIVGDEEDVVELAKRNIPAMWWPATVPRSFISNGEAEIKYPGSVFYGAVYGERQKFLEAPELKGLIVRPEQSLEYQSDLPKEFNELNAELHRIINSGQEYNPEILLTEYHKAYKEIRQENFQLWIKTLEEANSVVNLPQYGYFYSGRVYEAMAAGRPVIAARIENRFMNETVFEDGKDILLYDPDKPEELAKHIEKLRDNRDFANNIAKNARKKLKAFFTTEKRVEKLIHWIETGEKPEVFHQSSADNDMDLELMSEVIMGEKTNGIKEKKIANKKEHMNDYEKLISKGLIKTDQPVRLHLGCGEQYLDGYINIDYPASEHNVMDVKADYYSSITELNFPKNSVDEIRLHHVFEHFPRIVALGLLIKWHQCLKTGGQIYIETPDMIGSAETLLSNVPWKVKTGVIRHLAGDQSASWAYHVDQWFPERFERTLSALSYGSIKIEQVRWPHEPYLSNVHVIAKKEKDLSETDLVNSAEKILWESTVADAEKPTYELWCKQLRDFINTGNFSSSIAPETVPPSIQDMPGNFSQKTSGIALEEIHDFNQRSRDKWVIEQAKSIPAGSLVLDVGAGTCPYREFFSHCTYKSHDFKKYDGEKLGGATEYGEMDYVSDILSLPVDDMTFDAVLCTEVLEHVPEPVKALKELIRIVKPGGKLILTAPLGSGLHQLPFHYYGGYSPEWYRHFAEEFSCDVLELSPNGGFFKLMAQESARVANFYSQNPELHGENARELYGLFLEKIPRFLFELEEKKFIDQFTVGYHVLLSRKDTDLNKLKMQLKDKPDDIDLLLQIASKLNNNEADKYLLSAFCINPNHPKLQGLDTRV